MNWKLVAGLGATGALPAAIAILLRLDVAIVAILWTALAALVWVPVVLRTRDPSPFLTLLLIGVGAGVAAGAVDVAATFDPMLFVMALIIGTVWGALFGGIAVGVRKFRPAA